MNQIRKFNQVKIVATFGPALNDPLLIKNLINEGVTVFRFNCSHGNFVDLLPNVKMIREVAETLNMPVSILLDTKGPEVRVGKFIKNKPCLITKNSEIIIDTYPAHYAHKFSNHKFITMSYDFARVMNPGDLILIDDGKLKLKVISVNKYQVVAVALNTLTLTDNKRVNLPGKPLDLAFLSIKDIDDIIVGINNRIDFIAASFVNSKADVFQIRQLLEKHNANYIQIISKIESELAIINIEEIIIASDGLMIARGDLSLEMPYYKVPYWQEIMVDKSLMKGKSTIIATQMLESMIENPSPTRAEVNDVATAAKQGAGATMLSAESAIGHYPLETVQTMVKINNFYVDKPCVWKNNHLLEVKLALFSDHPAIIAVNLLLKRFNNNKTILVLIDTFWTQQFLQLWCSFANPLRIFLLTSYKTEFTKYGITRSVFPFFSYDWSPSDTAEFWSLLQTFTDFEWLYINMKNNIITLEQPTTLWT